jgi:hypothetical protein
VKRIRDFVAVDPALQPDPSAWEGLDRSRPAGHTVETRIRIVVYSKHKTTCKHILESWMFVSLIFSNSFPRRPTYQGAILLHTG